MRCLCCNKELNSADDYEKSVSWHRKCIKDFFGTSELPELHLTDMELDKLAQSTISKGLTVPGVQKKLSLHLSKTEAKLTIVDYPTGYILKPQSKDFNNLPEAEYLVMKMAEIVDIKTVKNALLKLDNQYAYITKRVDRNNNQMLAMEDFCQLSNRITADKYRGSYEGCGKVIHRYSRYSGLDKTELFYRLIFCFITGNSDMHLKNFSLIEDAPGSRVFRVSPAYDLLADKEQMALTVNGKKKNIRKKDFYALAESLEIEKKVADRLIAKVLKKKDKLIEEVERAYIPASMKEGMLKLMEERCHIFDI